MTASDPSQYLRVDHLATDVGRRAVRGSVVSIAAQTIKIGTQLAAVVVLARLLPPRAFGLIAMVAAINAVFDLVKELGLSAATIRKSDISHRQVSALFWINAATGLGIAAILAAVAPLLARFYGEPELIDITRFLSLAFVINGLSIQHWALLRRQMRFVATASMDAAGDVAGLAAAVAVALAGGGYWALVAQRLVGPVLVLFGVWITCRWRPGLPHAAIGLADLLGYGAAFTISNLAIALSRSVDQILVGWLWGPSSLGYYERASKLAVTPINNINIPLYSVAMPALCRIVDDPVRYRRAFANIIERMAMVVVPSGCLLAMSSSLVVKVLFGASWAPAAPLVAFFALAGAVLPLSLASYLLPMTQNRPRDLMRVSIVDSILCLIVVLAGLPFGVMGVAGAYGVGAWLVRTPVAFWLTTRRGPVPFSVLLRAVAPSLGAGVTVACAASLSQALLLPTNLAPPFALLFLLIVGLVVAVGVFAMTQQSRRILFTLLAPLAALAATSRPNKSF